MRIVCTIVAALAIVCASSTSGALEVRIRGESTLDVSVNAAGTVAQVAGLLKDDLGRGIPQRSVVVDIVDPGTGGVVVTSRPVTGVRGDFAVQEELPPGRYQVIARFEESDHLDGSNASATVQLEPATVELAAFGPDFVAGADVPSFVSARATAGGTGVQGAAEVLVGGVSVGRMTLDRSGRGAFDIAPHLQPGNNVIVVRVPGSAFRLGADASIVVRAAGQMELTATIEERLDRLARGVAVVGTVRDEFGGIPQMRVRIALRPSVYYEEPTEAVSRLLVDAWTNERGEFVGFVSSSELVDGVYAGSAAIKPPGAEELQVDAGTIDVDNRAFRWFVNGIGVTAMLAGLLVLLAHVLRLVWARVQAFRRRRERAIREEKALEATEAILPVFLEDDHGAVAARGRADVGGVVWNEWHPGAVADAKIRLESRDGVAREAVTDAHGRFQLDGLQDGQYVLTVERWGFMRGQMELRIPHDGRLSNFRVDLVPVPLKIRRLYQAVMEQARGEDRWGQLTPREIEQEAEGAQVDAAARDALRTQIAARLEGEGGDEVDGASVLGALTTTVEEAYFSGRVYGEEAFQFARGLALKLRERRQS